MRSHKPAASFPQDCIELATRAFQGTEKNGFVSLLLRQFKVPFAQAKETEISFVMGVHQVY